MSQEENKAVEKAEKNMEFVPYGTKDMIKLSIAIVKRYIVVPTKNGHTCSDDDATKFMMMCRARRLNPFEGDAYLIGYDTASGPKFSLITAHQAFLKRAELNRAYDGMRSGIIVMRNNTLTDLEGDFHLDDDVVVGGWATVFFKTRKEPIHRRVRLKRFKRNTQIWNDDPAGMICKCAEADALRSSFPTMLGGMYLKEELEIPADAKTVAAPIFEKLAQMSEDDKKTIEVDSEFSLNPPEPNQAVEPANPETNEQK